MTIFNETSIDNHRFSIIIEYEYIERYDRTSNQAYELVSPLQLDVQGCSMAYRWSGMSRDVPDDCVWFYR